MGVAAVMALRVAGKTVGTKTYVHRDYARRVIPDPLLGYAEAVARSWKFAYVIVKWDALTRSVSLIESPDFDTAPEPVVGRSLVVSAEPDTPPKVVSPPADPWVYHHKWMMVDDDYRGFDVAAAKTRSARYEDRPTRMDRQRMGKQSVWRYLLQTWGLQEK